MSYNSTPPPLQGDIRVVVLLYRLGKVCDLLHLLGGRGLHRRAIDLYTYPTDVLAPSTERDRFEEATREVLGMETTSGRRGVAACIDVPDIVAVTDERPSFPRAEEGNDEEDHIQTTPKRVLGKTVVPVGPPHETGEDAVTAGLTAMDVTATPTTIEKIEIRDSALDTGGRSFGVRPHLPSRESLQSASSGRGRDLYRRVIPLPIFQTVLPAPSSSRMSRIVGGRRVGYLSLNRQPPWTNMAIMVAMEKKDDMNATPTTTEKIDDIAAAPAAIQKKVDISAAPTATEKIDDIAAAATAAAMEKKDDIAAAPAITEKIDDIAAAPSCSNTIYYRH